MSGGRGPSGTVRSKNGRYYPVVRYYLDGVRKERWLDGCKTQAAAKKALRKALGAQDEGTWNPTAEVSTFGDYLTQKWLPSLHGEVRETTLAAYSRHVRCYLVPQLGPVKLDKLTAAHLAALYGHLRSQGAKGRPLSEATVVRVHATTSKALQDAVELGLLAVNPARKVSRKSRPKQRLQGGRDLKYWTAAQLGSFLNQARENAARFYPVARLAAYTGMRRGEVVGVRWQDIDLEGGYLVVRQTITTVDDLAKGSGGTLVTGSPKSGKGRRIDLDPETVAVLRAWSAQQKRDRLALGGAWPTHDLVFTREDGAGVHPDYVSGLFDRLVKTSGLPRITLHCLRHTHATLLLAAGVPAKVVSERLGHANVQITLDIYGHVMEGMQGQAVAVFASVMGDG